MQNGMVDYNSIMGGDCTPIEINQQSFDGFYVSYNDCDSKFYGCATTALVLGQMQKFYILKGDHRREYAKIVKQGFDRCFDYYQKHLAESHPYSDRIQ